MKITWLGHACFRIETGASVILLDPFLKPSPTFKASGLAFADVTKGVTHVGLTHGHDDHTADAFGVATANATLFAMVELADFMEAKGVKSVEAMNIGGTVRSEDFDLSLVNAVHSSSSSEGTYFGNPCGIVIAAKDGTTLLHMGDTDIFSDMGLINEMHKPDVGLVPIGDRFTMGARSAAMACRKFFNFKTIIPCHYGTFPIIDANANAFVSLMDGSNVRVPEIGETIEV